MSELQAKKHTLVRKLQRIADRDAACITHGDFAQAERSHAELSLELERTVADRKAEQDFYGAEWGEKPTRTFFSQPPNARQSGGIDRLYHHTLQPDAEWG